MTYLYIILGIWTFLAVSWSVALLAKEPENGNRSKLERLIQAVEAVGEAYRKSQL